MTTALVQWQRERFPLRNGIFFAVFYASALLVGRISMTGGPVTIGMHDVPGFAALCAFFLLLRVLDEHKDFCADSAAHPERALQRGLVTLDQLKVIGLVAVAIQLGVSLWLDAGIGQVTLSWAAALVWSALMAKEFFAREWIRHRILFYAFSHMLVMPLVAVWIASMGAIDSAHASAVWVFAGLAFLAGLAFEVARKIRAPNDEHPMADSYTQSLGVARATALLMGVVCGAAVVAMALMRITTGSLPGYLVVALAACVLFATIALSKFRTSRTSYDARRSETAAGIAALAAQIVVIVAVVAARGLQ
jgi:hypothetical protein